MDAAPDVQALARDLGVRRELLYRWHHLYIGGGEAALRDSGRPRRVLDLSSESGAEPAPPADVPMEPPVADDLVRAQARIAELERKIGRQQLDLDFFRTALRHVRETRQTSGVPGATASSR
jgi:transposase